MPQKITAAIVGTGFIGPAHLEALRRIPNIEVTGLVEVNQEVADAKAAELGIPNAYTFDNMLKDDSINVVHICTPNFLHFPQAKACMLAGKHVVCEKPLSVTVEEAEELVSLAKETGLINAVHFNLRYYPMVRQMKVMREKGELGEVYSVMGSYLQDWLFFKTDYSWRLDPKQSGGSRAVADIGSHLLDMTEYVTGLKITAVMADFSTVFPKRLKPLKAVESFSGKALDPSDYQEYDVTSEDYATILLRFDNGRTGSITVSQINAGRKNRLNIEVSGSKSSFEFNAEKPNELWIGKRETANSILMKDPSLVDEGARSLVSFPGGHQEGFPDTSKQLFKEVYAAVREGKQPESPTFPTFADGLRELIIGDAIVESNASEAWVKI
ncbi:Gfo/Idh/MocA family protein [Algoriphagus aquimarinus]|uniref:Gfo/Idh/MocA family oxidoreductase n=1 Tax=Algoriphagus aquimarinus TaxID=237018 RepID=A0A5C7AYA6_9BACT|nr:Gfo/Idh/MocA family oxidoreductase [Algoriphagus aquimarinus]TXE13658.1 Gfo/Idh/MocA family oxidoreductase [Algoriphagus aquimarinus]|tara:strand:- start:949 stop:2097 length:1149 start_codon:yes stop_codon:yes gene_type:complete